MMAIITPTEHRTSVHKRCVIDIFVTLFVALQFHRLSEEKKEETGLSPLTKAPTPEDM